VLFVVTGSEVELLRNAVCWKIMLNWCCYIDSGLEKMKSIHDEDS